LTQSTSHYGEKHITGGLGFLSLGKSLSDVHWLRFKVGLVYMILATILGIVLSVLFYPFWVTAQQQHMLAVPLVIAVFLIMAYAVGWLILLIVRMLGVCR